MFYTQFIKLCNEQKKEPSLVAEAIGLNRSSATAWKKGSKPKATTVAALADYFGVDVSVFSDDKRDTVGVDEDLAEYLEDLRERPETRALLEASRGMTKEQVPRIVPRNNAPEGFLLRGLSYTRNPCVSRRFLLPLNRVSV